MIQGVTGETPASPAVSVSTPRGQWASKLGFTLAAAGSAVGLGNIWRFPYVTGKYGGGAFVLTYLLCVLLVGLPIMVAELLIGRRAQQDPVGTFRKLQRSGSYWHFVGWLGVAAGFVILSFYSVVAGWTLSYLFKAIAGFSGSATDLRAQFEIMVGSAGTSIGWHSVFMILTMAVVIGGVQRGIERWTKMLMPALFFLLAGLTIYGLFGTAQGGHTLAFLFHPDFSKLSTEGFLAALGQAFFSLSLGMGAIITYGSYLGRGANLTRSAVVVSVLDTLVACMAGIAIFALVFEYGMEPGEGPGLVFVTLPILFAKTGPIVSIPFFLLLTFAALTSTVSLLEVVVAHFIDALGWSRQRATILVGIIIYLLGVPSAISSLKAPVGGGMGFLDLFDHLSANYMLPLGGLLTCLFVGWALTEKDRREEFGSSGTLYRVWVYLLKFVSPVAVAIILLNKAGLF